VIKNIQAYEKTSKRQDAKDDQNDHHSMLLPGGSVVIIIITAQFAPTSFRGFPTVM
jgi:hypothetical protein